MRNRLKTIKQEQWIGIVLVVGLHLAALVTLWSYRIIPSPDAAITLMVNMISQPSDVVKPPPKPKSVPVEPPAKQLQLAAETPVVQPDAPVAYVPPTPLVAPAVTAVAAPPMPEMIQLAGELSVSCPDRSVPKYPVLSVRLNEQGKVVLRVELDTSGKIVNVSVKTHSGFPRLDEAAINTVKNWHCKPASQNGVAVAAVALQPFNFVLE